MYNQLSQIFSVLSDPTRIEILSYLDLYGEKECQDLRNQFPLSQPTMSHHFSQMVETGLLIKEKKGTSNAYRLNKQLFKELHLNLNSLLETQNLAAQLEYQSAQSKMRKDPFARRAIEESIESINNSNLKDKALQIGQKIPNFSLLDANEHQVKSLELLKKHDYVIISFYRGGWCPYCNLELRTLQKYLAEFHKYKAQLVAISPQTPDNTLTTQEKLALQFPVLSDVGNKVAKQFGIVFDVSPNLKKAYQHFNIDLTQANGKDSSELPVPATFVVNNKGKVLLRFVEADYTKRLDPKEILQVLAK